MKASKLGSAACSKSLVIGILHKFLIGYQTKRRSERSCVALIGPCKPPPSAGNLFYRYNLKMRLNDLITFSIQVRERACKKALFYDYLLLAFLLNKSKELSSQLFQAFLDVLSTNNVFIYIAMFFFYFAEKKNSCLGFWVFPTIDHFCDICFRLSAT